MRQKDGLMDLVQKYRKLEKSLESVELPTSDELRSLLEQHDSEPQRRAPFVPLSQPVRRPLQHPVWRYAASVLLLVTMGLTGWFFLQQSSKSGPGVSPVADVSTGDTVSVDPQRPDSLLPMTPALEWKQEGGQMAFELPRPEMEYQHQTLVNNEINNATILSHTSDSAGGMMADNEEVSPKPKDLPADSNSDPHIIPDYPDRKMMKDADIKQNEDSDRKALRGESKKPAKKKRKFSLNKNDKDNSGSNVNVVVPERTPQPHQVPVGNGRFITIYH